MTTPGADAHERPDPGPRVPRAPRPALAPARPALGGERFTAALEPGRRPRALAVAIALWLVAAALHAAAAAVLWAAQDTVRATIAVAVRRQDPSTAPDVVGDVARWAFLAGAGSVALVALVLAAAALALRRGGAGARPVLLVAGAAAVAVTLVVQDLVRAPGRALLDDPARLAALVPVPVVVAAAVAMLLPGVGAWLRRAQARVR